MEDVFDGHVVLCCCCFFHFDNIDIVIRGYNFSTKQPRMVKAVVLE